MLEGGLPGESVPLFVQDLGGLFRMSGFPALPVERSIQPVRRIALHLPGGGQRLRRLQGAPVPRGPRAGGVWDKGRDISIEVLPHLGFRLSGVESFLGPIFSSAMAWRRGTRHVLSAIGHYVPIRGEMLPFVNSPWVGGCHSKKPNGFIWLCWFDE